MLKLTIIIVNYNCPEILECLNSVYSTIKTPFEIFVVDNKSLDNSVARIKQAFPDVKIIENLENKGYGCACNQAMRIACGKHILILNPDIILEENTIDELLKYLEQNKEAKIVSCKLKNSDGTIQDSYRKFPTIFGLLKRQIKTRFRTKKIEVDKIKVPTKVDWVSGALMLLREKYYFDERYFLYFEDVDLCKTVGNVYYYPKVFATHLAKRESAKNFKLILWHIKSAMQYFVKTILKYLYKLQ